MQIILTILTNTPVWVWGILIAVLAIGLSRTKTGPRRLPALVIPSSIFGLVTLAKLFTSQFAQHIVLGTVIGLALGIVLVISTKPARHTVRLPDNRLMIKGEWMTLYVVMAVFLGNYAAGVATSMAPDLAQHIYLNSALATINGFSAAFMIGRAIAHMRVAAGQYPSQLAQMS